MVENTGPENILAASVCSLLAVLMGIALIVQRTNPLDHYRALRRSHEHNVLSFGLRVVTLFIQFREHVLRQVSTSQLSAHGPDKIEFKIGNLLLA